MMNSTTLAPTTEENVYHWSSANDFPTIRIIDICILIVSVLGNSLVVVAILREKRLRTSLNYLVLNLSICNVLIVVTSIPFTLAQVLNNYQFIFGRIGCHILYPLATLSVNASVFTLLCITIDRYIAIAHPLSWRNPQAHILKVIVVTYIYGLVTVIPYSLNLQYLESDDYGKQCNEIWSVQSQRAYTIVLFLLQYGIPLPVMIVLYSSAWLSLKRQNDFTIRISQRNRDANDPSLYTKNEFKRIKEVYTPTPSKPTIFALLEKHFQFCSGRRKKSIVNERFIMVARHRQRQTIRTLLTFCLIILIFAVSFLPNQIYWLWVTFYTDSSQSDISDDLKTAFYVLHYSNCVLNPIVYGGLNNYFWRGYKRVMCCTKKDDTSRWSSSFRTSSRMSRTSSTGTASSRQTAYQDFFEGGILTNNPVQVIDVGSLASSLNDGCLNDDEAEESKDNADEDEQQTLKVCKKYSGHLRSRVKLSLSPPNKIFRKLTLPLLSTTGTITVSDQQKEQRKLRKLTLPHLSTTRNIAVLNQQKEQRKHRKLTLPLLSTTTIKTKSNISSPTTSKEVTKSSTLTNNADYLGIESNNYKQQKNCQPLIDKGDCLTKKDEHVNIELLDNPANECLDILVESSNTFNTQEESIMAEDSTHGTMESSVSSVKQKLVKQQKIVDNQTNIMVELPQKIQIPNGYHEIRSKEKINNQYSSSEQKRHSSIIPIDSFNLQQKRHSLLEQVRHSPSESVKQKRHSSCEQLRYHPKTTSQVANQYLKRYSLCDHKIYALKIENNNNSNIVTTTSTSRNNNNNNSNNNNIATTITTSSNNSNNNSSNNYINNNNCKNNSSSNININNNNNNNNNSNTNIEDNNNNNITNNNDNNNISIVNTTNGAISQEVLSTFGDFLDRLKSKKLEELQESYI